MLQMYTFCAQMYSFWTANVILIILVNIFPYEGGIPKKISVRGDVRTNDS